MITVIMGFITTLIMGLLKSQTPLTNASAIIKQLVVMVIAALVSFINMKWGFAVSEDLQAWVINWILTALSGFGFYNLYAANAKAGTSPDNTVA